MKEKERRRRKKKYNKLMMNLVERELFGGAITIQLPNSFIDSSNLRQVPDHQEIFSNHLNINSLNNNDNSKQSTNCQNIIIELLSEESNESNNSITSFLFNDIVNANDVAKKDSKIWCEWNDETTNENEKIATHFTSYVVKFLIGEMMVNKNNCLDRVFVYLCVIRLKNVETEFVISFFDPITSTSITDSTTSDPTTTDSTTTDSSTNNKTNKKLKITKEYLLNKNLNETLKQFQFIINSLKIKDWSLFQ
jgi:hypothetical protein